MAAAEEATRRFPDDAVARTTLAKALGEAGQAEDAVEVAEEAPHRVSDPDVARGRPAAVPGGAAAVQARTPVPSGTAPPRSAEDDSARLATLLGDGPVLRAWARRLHWTSGVTTPGTLSEEARRRIEPLLAAARADAQAAGQGGLVLAMVDRDGLTEALGLLREARQRFPGSAWVVYALAWAERQRWLRLEARERTPALRSEALRPWRALERLDARYRPVRLVGAARVWLTPDGADDPGSREALGEAAWQLHRWDDLADTATTTSAPFLDWWAGRARAALLPDPGVRRAEDLPPGLGDMSTNLADPEVSAELDALEQDYVGRFAVA